MRNNVYITAITITVCVILLNQGFIQYWLYQKKEDGKIINIGGRQRMYSQRLLSLTYSYRNTGNQEDRSKQEKVRDSWVESHYFLMEVFENKSRLTTIEKEVLERLNLLTHLLVQGEAFSQSLGNLSSENFELFKNNQESFLFEMNNIVNLLEEESLRKLKILIRIEILFAVCSLLLVFYEIVFVFKKINQQLERQNLELKESNQMLEKYAYIAAHDLRTPIQNILNFALVLKNRLKEHLGKQEKEFFNFVIEGAERSKETTEDLLSFSSINNQGFHLDFSSPTQIVKDVITDLKTVIELKKAIIELENFPAEICLDKGLFYVVFKNLISNSLKFIPEGKRPKIKLSYQSYETHHQFEISDNGIGIEQVNANKIFELFKRLNTQKEYKGTGIGLAICQKILEKHQGEISLVPKEQPGATFKLWFPINLNKS